MAKMWAGRTSGQTSQIADAFNSSIAFDSRMYAQDITGSMAHAAMLGACGIITQTEADELIAGLQGILDDIESGALEIDMQAEDIHMFVEEVLTARLGDVGKKLHTARSRNDQVALDLRLYMGDKLAEMQRLVAQVALALTLKAEEYQDAIMPGYTHLQRAQPILFAHQLLAYQQMLMRDIDRLADCRKRTLVSPIGACALAGTTYPTDRVFEAEKLGMSQVCANSIDAVSDRDFCVEFLACASMCMMHLSRLSEELILWSSWEFGFISLSDEFTTGSSIMPQKKNSDMAELVRGKTGRVYGHLMGLLTTLKGLPLAYNKDMQEDKEAVFDALDTLEMSCKVMAPMIAGLTAHPDKMMAAAQSGFINATDLADYLVGKGMAFREAYKLVGGTVAYCIEHQRVLESMSLEEYQAIDPRFDADLFAAIDLKTCVEKRTSLGGTSPDSVAAQIAQAKAALSPWAD